MDILNIYICIARGQAYPIPAKIESKVVSLSARMEMCLNTANFARLYIFPVFYNISQLTFASFLILSSF